MPEALADYPSRLGARSWAGYDEAFSAKVGQAGILRPACPREYGGHGRTAFERYVILEVMLAAGAPVSAHWFVDQQTGPLILISGTAEMKRRIVSAITRGEAIFTSACRRRTLAPISPQPAPRPPKWSSAGCSTATRFGPLAPIGKSSLRTETLAHRQ